MDFLFVNTQELTALIGLPYIQQVTYLLGIRPYMDRKSFIVGIKRRISYQSLAEALYIEPHPGIQSGSPSRQQLRRVIKGLERVGLVQIQSSEKHLILKCLLANSDVSIPNKPDTKPTHESDTKANAKNHDTSTNYDDTPKKTNSSQTLKADIPHNSENKYVCVRAHFEKFWAMYPKKNGKQKAWEEFQALQPSEEMLTPILTALQQQIEAVDLLQSQGCWVPKWKFPANWLAQHCWEDEIDLTPTMEIQHDTHQRHSATKSPVDDFWESCKAGAQPSTSNYVLQGRTY
jgi:hypothetical protein